MHGFIVVRNNLTGKQWVSQGGPSYDVPCAYCLLPLPSDQSWTEPYTSSNTGYNQPYVSVSSFTTDLTLDRLGSVAVLTDGAGAVSERDSYDAWGRRRNSDGTDNPSCSITSATTRGFTGHEMLDTVCQVNANARLYDPTIARFMSPDSMVSDPFDGQSFNRYSYVENGPLSATDPTGNVNSRIVLPSKVQPACTWGCAQAGMQCWGCIGPGLTSDSNGLPVPAAWSAATCRDERWDRGGIFRARSPIPARHRPRSCRKVHPFTN